MNSTPPCYRCSTEVGQHSVTVQGISLDGKAKTIRVCMRCAYPHEVVAAQKAQLPTFSYGNHANRSVSHSGKGSKGWHANRAKQLEEKQARKLAEKEERKCKQKEEDANRKELWKKQKRELEVLVVEMDKHLTVPIAERCKAHEGRKGVTWNTWHGRGFDCTETGPLDPLLVVEAYYWKQKGKCAYCRRDLNFRFHIEHMTPTSRGGTNHRNNITVSCASCNNDKGTMTANEYTPLLRTPKKGTKTIMIRKKGGQETRKVLDATKPKYPLEPGEPWWHDPRDIFEDLP